MVVSQSESYALYKSIMGLEYTDWLKSGCQDHPRVGNGMSSMRTIWIESWVGEIGSSKGIPCTVTGGRMNEYWASTKSTNQNLTFLQLSQKVCCLYNTVFCMGVQNTVGGQGFVGSLQHRENTAVFRISRVIQRKEHLLICRLEKEKP